MEMGISAVNPEPCAKEIKYLNSVSLIPFGSPSILPPNFVSFIKDSQLP